MGAAMYLYYILIDGDYQNDYLTHIPTHLQLAFRIAGEILAILIGK